MIQKNYRSISEVSELLKIKQHVIRYWDSQFEGVSTRLGDSKRTIFNRKNKTGRIFGILYETENEKSVNAQMVEDGLLEKFEQAA